MVGAYIQPSSTSGLTAATLNDFLHDFVAGLSGLNVALVFPRWQAEPPNIPQNGTAWAAVGVVGKTKDNYPFVGENVTDYNTDPVTQDYELQAQEELECLVSFYDLGTDGQADTLADLFCDNIKVPQNLELARTAGFAFVECSGTTNVPILLKQRWNNRVDVKFNIRQQVTRVYPVLGIESLDVTVTTD